MITKEQKQVWLDKLRDPNTPAPDVGFSGKCALYYALSNYGYKDMSEHWSAVERLVGHDHYTNIAMISDHAVRIGHADMALMRASYYIEACVETGN